MKKELKELVSKIDKLEQNINFQLYNYRELSGKLNNLELPKSKVNTMSFYVERGCTDLSGVDIEASVEAKPK